MYFKKHKHRHKASDAFAVDTRQSSKKGKKKMMRLKEIADSLTPILLSRKSLFVVEY